MNTVRYIVLLCRKIEALAGYARMLIQSTNISG